MYIELRVEGPIGPAIAGAFDDVDVRTETVLSGELVDDAALHGLLARVRDLGLTVVGLRASSSADAVNAEATR